MSFLKIKDPAKRDAMVKEYLEIKKNIRDNLLSERTGELELQTDLSKFYRPITETQKATAREITEGLKPIREGIEKLPQAIQPIKDEEEEEEEEEEYDEEEDESIGETARHYLNKPNTDKIFGVRKDGKHYWIGDKHVIIKDDNIYLPDGTGFIGTDGLWGLITSRDPDKDLIDWSENDMKAYAILMRKTNALHKKYNPRYTRPRSSGSSKWKNILSPIWYNEPLKGVYKGYKIPQPWYEGKGVVVIPSDPNVLLERLDLLLASQDAGHTGVGNELISICDELKRQGVLDMKTYKKINCIIKK